MPTHPKYRNLKRPKVVAKRNLKLRDYKKSSGALICKKLQTNNKALAQALSKQKEETQQLTLDNLELTRQLNETNHQKRRHMEAFSIILKNSREAMNLMVKATEQVVSAISTCNTLLHPESGNPPRPSSTRDPNRRVSTKSPNKSPARGVVQPMVSGHAIAQPAIALSRIRIVSMPPNVSDIEETTESPGTPTRPVSRMPASRNRALNRGIPPMMPQRIRVSSPRDETLPPDDRRLSNISRRSSRYQKRKSRTSRHSDLEPRDSINQIETTMRTPRVSLEDVSRLMHNSHSINVRSLMDIEEGSGFQGSPEAGDNQSEEFGVPTSSGEVSAGEVSPGAPVSSESPTSSPVSRTSSPTYQLDHRARKERKRRHAKKDKMGETKLEKSVFSRVQQRVFEDDPLEGTSWRYSNEMGGGSEGADDGNANESNDLSNGTGNETNGTNLENSDGSRMNDTSSRMFDGSLRDSAGFSTTNRMSLTMMNPHNGWEGSDDDDERCQVIDIAARRNSDGETTNFTAVFARNVCTSRGRVEDFDPDEFTMMRRGNRPFKPCVMDELEMPDIPPQELEQPLVRAPEVMAEPEITKTIQIQGVSQQVGIQSATGELLPNVTFNTSVTMPVDTVGRESEDDTVVVPNGRRNRAVVPIVESSSESEASTPPRKNNKRTSRTKGSKRRDPSSAKVVLEKLKAPEQRKRPGSPVPRPSSVNGYLNRTSNSLTSDSESSNASFGSNGRPRRQRAPVNFAEPSLRKKLRRE
ncbi:uncharacterized protein LOC107048675 [Diachasma alloeum]|uniref:uncharacterized protein LOC107048675 n=1 Tax=Diachasma alloeum TaxID=454923 RepID=UPI0007384263|nr:uncharacterized protein LOC107048675 [Diachasma alloeum]